MQEAASILTGRHDFASFCGAGAQVKTTVRLVTGFLVERKGEMVCLQVSGRGFLYNMVRIFAGTLIEVGNGVSPPENVEAILDAGDRGAAGPTAPACGLTLLGVRFLKD